MKQPNLNSFPEGNDKEIIHFFEEWIVFIANLYCKKNSIDPYQEMDLHQFIRLRLLEQFPKIKGNYKGEAKLRTYMSAIILNLCREFRRVNCSKSVFTEANSEQSLINQYLTSNKGEHTIAIKKETEKLNQIFQMYGSKGTKLKIALSLYYGLNPGINNLEVYCNGNKRIAYVVQNEIAKKGELNKKDSVKILTGLFNQIENKSNSVEATRKWVTRKIDDIVAILNHQGSEHTKETLGVLIEMNQPT